MDRHIVTTAPATAERLIAVAREMRKATLGQMLRDLRAHVAKRHADFELRGRRTSAA